MSMIRFDNLPPTVMESMCTPMHQIIPAGSTHKSSAFTSGSTPQRTGGLFVGSISAVNDAELLREKGISVLVQCLDVPWLPESERDGFQCYRIDIIDKDTQDLRPHLNDACRYIDTAMHEGKGVLVHCHQGISRSPAIVIAYLMRCHSMSYIAAHDLCLSKRACIKPNAGFVRTLKQWEVDSTNQDGLQRPSITKSGSRDNKSQVPASHSDSQAYVNVSPTNVKFVQ